MGPQPNNFDSPIANLRSNHAGRNPAFLPPYVLSGFRELDPREFRRAIPELTLLPTTINQHPKKKLVFLL